MDITDNEKSGISPDDTKPEKSTKRNGKNE